MSDDNPGIHETLRGATGQVCAKCGRLKHVRLFRRILTRAQAEARGYFDHDIHPMHVPSKYCTECQKRPRPRDLRHLPPKALQNELTNQRIKPQLVHAEILRRSKIQPVSAQEKGRRGGPARWEKFHQERWRYAKERIRKELVRLRAQSAYYQRRLAENAEYFGAHYEAVLAFNAAAASTLRELRAQATGFILRRRPSDDTLTWRQWMGPAEQARLHALWDAIPEPDEATLRAAFGKRSRATTFKSRLAMPMAIDTSEERFVLRGCPVKTRYNNDEDAEQRRSSIS